MKNRLSLLTALVMLSFVATTAIAHETYHSKFLGVCQKCAENIYAYWRPVECIDGGVEWQWVEELHCHCRPAYKGRKKWRFIDSPLANPANDKGWKHRFCKNKQHKSCCN